MREQPKLLLTGATGFLGSNLLRKLTAVGYHVVLLVRYTSNFSKISDMLGKVSLLYSENANYEKFFSQNKIDCVIHCATNYGRKGQLPLAILDTNLVLPLKLLQIGAENGLNCFINTDTVLGMNLSHYSLSKSQFKEWLKVYSDRLVCVNLALEHFYGPGDDESKFVTWLIRALLKNSRSLNLTSGDQKREFIYIDDVVDAFLRVIKSSALLENGYCPYEIGADKSIKIRDFVTHVKSLIKNNNTTLNFGAIPYRKGEVLESETDLSRIKELGWKAQVSLSAGLKKTIAFERAILDA
ncbi:MAG: NAD-dependent epimerase/dehydratase family protein [Elusimicrobiales bacterium]|jgi:nucleoside-diphosphate-sugar epimerase